MAAVRLVNTAAACGVRGGAVRVPSPLSVAVSLLHTPSPPVRWGSASPPAPPLSQSSVPLTRTRERHGASGLPYAGEESAPLPPVSR